MPNTLETKKWIYAKMYICMQNIKWCVYNCLHIGNTWKRLWGNEKHINWACQVQSSTVLHPFHKQNPSPLIQAPGCKQICAPHFGVHAQSRAQLFCDPFINKILPCSYGPQGVNRSVLRILGCNTMLAKSRAQLFYDPFINKILPRSYGPQGVNGSVLRILGCNTMLAKSRAQLFYDPFINKILPR